MLQVSTKHLMTTSGFRDVMATLRPLVITLGPCFDRLERFHFLVRDVYDLIQDEGG